MKIVVLSRKRPKNVNQIEKLFPTALWCISENDALDYKVNNNKMLIHPNDVIGIGRKRQWILDNVKDKKIFQVDDDISYLQCKNGKHGHKITSPNVIERLIENAGDITEDIGASVFGFNQTADIRKFSPLTPFALSGWVGTAIGFVGRDIRYDTSLITQADIDFCLKNLLKKRIIWIDERFSFVTKRFSNVGGSAGIRDNECYNNQLLKLKNRWGHWINIVELKGTKRTIINVVRKQSLEF